MVGLLGKGVNLFVVGGGQILLLMPEPNSELACSCLDLLSNQIISFVVLAITALNDARKNSISTRTLCSVDTSRAGNIERWFSESATLTMFCLYSLISGSPGCCVSKLRGFAGCFIFPGVCRSRSAQCFHSQGEGFGTFFRNA